jgi:hypothetical protein
MEVPTRNIYELHCKGSVQRSLAYPQFEAEGYMEYYFVQHVCSKSKANSNGRI